MPFVASTLSACTCPAVVTLPPETLPVATIVVPAVIPLVASTLSACTWPAVVTFPPLTFPVAVIVVPALIDPVASTAPPVVILPPLTLPVAVTVVPAVMLVPASIVLEAFNAVVTLPDGARLTMVISATCASA